MAINFNALIIDFKQNLPRLHGRHYIAAFFVLLLLCALYGNSLLALWRLTPPDAAQAWWQDSYLRQVIYFSFSQAFLSALLSIIIGLLFARALFYQQFIGKKYLLWLFSLTFVLPSLVAILGILGVYGGAGWLAQLAAALGFDWQPSIYGLLGILIAHLFFNIPLATRVFLQAYQAIPIQQHKLAAQLGIQQWQFIRWLEFPYLGSQILPTFVLIFMLCFTSFAVVLTLGGGPKFTTLEVAIYQAIIFDFDLSKAAQYAWLQFAFCLALFLCSALFSPSAETPLNQQQFWRAKQHTAVKIWQILLITLLSLFLLLPLLNIVASAVFSGAIFQAWQQAALWRAMLYSFSIAPLSASLAMLMALALLLASRRLHWLGFQRVANSMIQASLVILAIPMLLLAVGLFLWLREWQFNQGHLLMVVVLCNAVASLPFVLRILVLPMNNNLQHYEKLCQSLGITGWRRFRLIEWQGLKSPIKYAFALACCLSLGDFTAIALFGNQQFSSLPYLLYQQLGSYRGDEGAVTALVLLLSCLALFAVLEKNAVKE